MAAISDRRGRVMRGTRHSSYVVHSVLLALYGAERIRSLGFKPLLRELIAAGGDTDTIASMAGQVAGAFLGRQALPGDMLKRVPELAQIERIAGALAASLAER
jgi:ADP-ribosylglycohydrolase